MDVLPERLVAYAEAPAQYHVDIYRLLYDALGDRFQAVFRQSGLTRHPTWGEADLRNRTGLRDGYPSQVLSDESWSSIRGVVRAAGLKKGDALLLHTVLPRTSRRVAWLARRLGLRLLYRGSSYLGPYERPLKNALRTVRDVVSLWPIDTFCATGTVTWEFFERYGHGAPIVFSPYCSDEYLVSSVARERDALRGQKRRELGIGPEELLVVYAGRFIGIKNVGRLIQAWQRLEASVRGRLVLAGDGPERQEILRVARAPGKPAAQHLGFLHRRALLELLCASDVIAVPSLYEPWGVVVNEAIALNNVCLVSPAVGSARDLVREGVNGTYVDPFSVSSIAAGLERAAGLARSRSQTALDLELTRLFSARNAAHGVLFALGLADEPDVTRPPGLTSPDRRGEKRR